MRGRWFCASATIPGKSPFQQRTWDRFTIELAQIRSSSSLVSPGSSEIAFPNQVSASAKAKSSRDLLPAR